MTDNEIITDYREEIEKPRYLTVGIFWNVLDLINRQKAEIERLKEEVSKARRKALLEAKSKFAGHSDYHGDTILCKLICMAEGKEVGVATPLDKNKIKSEARKEFADLSIKKICEQVCAPTPTESYIVEKCNQTIENLLKEMESESK